MHRKIIESSKKCFSEKEYPIQLNAILAWEYTSLQNFICLIKGFPWKMVNIEGSRMRVNAAKAWRAFGNTHCCRKAVLWFWIGPDQHCFYWCRLLAQKHYRIFADWKSGWHWTRIILWNFFWCTRRFFKMAPLALPLNQTAREGVFAAIQVHLKLISWPWPRWQVFRCLAAGALIQNALQICCLDPQYAIMMMIMIACKNEKKQ